MRAHPREHLRLPGRRGLRLRPGHLHLELPLRPRIRALRGRSKADISSVPCTTRARNSVVECHLHTVEAVGSKPTAPMLKARGRPSRHTLGGLSPSVLSVSNNPLRWRPPTSGNHRRARTTRGEATWVRRGGAIAAGPSRRRPLPSSQVLGAPGSVFTLSFAIPVGVSRTRRLRARLAGSLRLRPPRWPLSRRAHTVCAPLASVRRLSRVPTFRAQTSGHTSRADNGDTSRAHTDSRPHIACTYRFAATHRVHIPIRGDNDSRRHIACTQRFAATHRVHTTIRGDTSRAPISGAPTISTPAEEGPSRGRGRDGPSSSRTRTAPAQIPASGTTAPGSYLGF